MYRYSRIVEIDDDYLKYLWCEDLRLRSRSKKNITK